MEHRSVATTGPTYCKTLKQGGHTHTHMYVQDSKIHLPSSFGNMHSMKAPL